MSRDGLLAPKRPATIGTDDDPIGLAITLTGSWLYAASYWDRSVTQYHTLENGALRALRPGHRVDAGLTMLSGWRWWTAHRHRRRAARHHRRERHLRPRRRGRDQGFGGDDTLYGDGCGGRAGPGSGADRLYRARATTGSTVAPAGTCSAGARTDRLDARDGRRDRFFCGRGRDVVKADPNERLDGCEQVGRNSP